MKFDFTVGKKGFHIFEYRFCFIENKIKTFKFAMWNWGLHNFWSAAQTFEKGTKIVLGMQSQRVRASHCEKKI